MAPSRHGRSDGDWNGSTRSNGKVGVPGRSTPLDSRAASKRSQCDEANGKSDTLYKELMSAMEAVFQNAASECANICARRLRGLRDEYEGMIGELRESAKKVTSTQDPAASGASTRTPRQRNPKRPADTPQNVEREVGIDSINEGADGQTEEIDSKRPSSNAGRRNDDNAGGAFTEAELKDEAVSRQLSQRDMDRALKVAAARHSRDSLFPSAQELSPSQCTTPGGASASAPAKPTRPCRNVKLPADVVEKLVCRIRSCAIVRGGPRSSSQLDEAFVQRLDHDGTGLMDVDEWIRAVRTELKLSKAEISNDQCIRIFTLLDDGTGVLEITDFSEIAKGIEYASNPRVKRLLKDNLRATEVLKIAKVDPQRENSPADRDFASETIMLPGTRVRVVGLLARADLNGRVGNIVEFEQSSWRYKVMMEDDSRMAFGPKHLREVRASSCSSR